MTAYPTAYNLLQRNNVISSDTRLKITIGDIWLKAGASLCDPPNTLVRANQEHLF